MMRCNNGLEASIGLIVSAGDNVAIESYFALLPQSGLIRKKWVTREHLRLANVTWIERTYHCGRRQGSSGMSTPIELQTIYNQSALPT